MKSLLLRMELTSREFWSGYWRNKSDEFKFSIWLENFNTQPAWVKALFKSTWTMGKIISKILPIDSKLFSPYIQIRAQVPQ